MPTHAQAVHIAVVGATGAVGLEMLEILFQRNFPAASVRALASARSVGKKLPFGRGELEVQELTPSALLGVDLALFSAGSGVTKAIVPELRRTGWQGSIIDNSSAYRMDPAVPLVIPEVNPEALRASGERSSHGWPVLIANPNCSTIILLVALTPLRRAFGVREAVVSTYQAASGAGASGILELEAQTRADLAGDRVSAAPSGSIFHEPYAFNLFSHNSGVDAASGLNVEEIKMIKETHKIWADDSVRIAPTCVRVPVRRAHAESVHVTFERPATLDQVREALARAPGVRIVDDPDRNDFPTPLKSSGRDEVLVGRIRRSPIAGHPAGHGPTTRFDLFICGDQLRKGAALNAVQIAEALLANEPSRRD